MTFAMGSPDVVGLVEKSARCPPYLRAPRGAELTGEKATPVPPEALFFLCFWQEADARPAIVAVGLDA
jgi:hypothetical protein